MGSCSGPKAAGAANHSEPGTVSSQGICQLVKGSTSQHSSALPVQPTSGQKFPKLLFHQCQVAGVTDELVGLQGHQSKCTHSIKDKESCYTEVLSLNMYY